VNIGDEYEHPNLYKFGLTYHMGWLEKYGAVFINHLVQELNNNDDSYRRCWAKEDDSTLNDIASKARQVRPTRRKFKIVRVYPTHDPLKLKYGVQPYLDIVTKVAGKFIYCGRAERIPMDSDFNPPRDWTEEPSPKFEEVLGLKKCTKCGEYIKSGKERSYVNLSGTKIYIHI